MYGEDVLGSWSLPSVSGKFGDQGRAEGALAHRGHVGSGQRSSSTVSKQEDGLGFHCSMFQQLSIASVTTGKSHHWAQAGDEELPRSLCPVAQG